MKVSDILKAKGNRVVTVRPDEAVSTFIKRLRLEKIGAMVVTEDDVTVVGLITERDVVHGLASEGAGVLAKQVRDLMTRTAVTCAPDDSVQEVMVKMTQRRTRHLPVIDGHRARRHDQHRRRGEKPA